MHLGSSTEAPWLSMHCVGCDNPDKHDDFGRKKVGPTIPGNCLKSSDLEPEIDTLYRLTSRHTTSHGS